MIFFTAIAAAALAAQPAESTGSLSEPRLVRSLHRYANCIAQDRSQAARALLALDFRTRGYGRAMVQLARNDGFCEGAAEAERSFGSSGLLFAGALAEALLRRDLAGRELAPRVAYDPARPTIEARNGGEVMAICVVREDAGATSRLLASGPATAEEVAALRAMSAVLSGCVPARSEARFTREALRAVIALAAYRLVQHNRAAAP
jgi:hypothetical protein